MSKESSLLDAVKKYPLWATIEFTVDRLNEHSTLDEIRDAVLDLAGISNKEDPLTQEVIRQGAIRVLKQRVKFHSPQRLLDLAFKEAAGATNEK